MAEDFYSLKYVPKQLPVGMSVGMGMVNFNKNGVGLESNSTFKLANQLMPSNADSTPSTSGKPIKAVSWADTLAQSIAYLSTEIGVPSFIPSMAEKIHEKCTHRRRSSKRVRVNLCRSRVRTSHAVFARLINRTVRENHAERVSVLTYSSPSLPHHARHRYRTRLRTA
uniref:Uncharacterized protein n=1 Tax=Timema cristinae TaxID=61476 RepID=A0A7R9GZ52_TIMCR|nr:unnamed protein product [Timema cristinae]